MKKIFVICLIALVLTGCVTDVLGLKHAKDAIPALPGGPTLDNPSVKSNPSVFLKLWNMLGFFIILQVLILVFVVHKCDLVVGLLMMSILTLVSFGAIKLFHLNYNIFDIAVINAISFYIIWSAYDKYLKPVLKI